ncbi:MAG TPA: carboxypeptidase-like regulatory domain-containing protein [Bryobacteraceae bacterium]|nr:carboxypeptidase-like regulatory domain-containing protein [Bryobacteraceae bacterium]
MLTRGLVTPAAVLVSVLSASLLLVSPARAAAPVRLSGQLDGLVTDVSGKPQPGAIIVLLNQQGRLLQRSATDGLGSFSFGDLMPDLYSIQVSFSSFVPAIRERIQVKAGMRSLLSVNLSRVFSSVQLVATTPVPAGLMSDSWKWTLRADNPARPVLRILPEQPQGNSDPTAEAHGPMFSDSRGLFRISASDGAPVDGDSQADLGTAFAFTTSLYGANRLQVAGDFGYGVNSNVPSGAFRTTYSRELADGPSPEVSVTMRQLYVPLRMGQSFYGGNDGSMGVLRTTGVSFGDTTQLNDHLEMEYGFEFDSVSFLNHLSYFSPFAKFTYTVPHGKVDFTWTSGNARPELGMSGADPNMDLQRDLASLSSLPGLTLVNGQSKVERGNDYELGVSQRFGSREFRVSTYQESVSNTAVTVAAPEGGLFAGDLLPNFFSNTASFDMGRFQALGYTAAVTQDLGENYKITLMYGSAGVVSPRGDEISGPSADDLRKILSSGQRPAVTLQVSGTVKHTGTRFMTSYQWTDYQSAMPGPLFSTQPTRPEPGFNVMVRQPVPTFPRMPWRMEASAELRNLLAQGYLPLTTPGGNQVLLMNTPRSVRGALAFVF